MFEINKNEYGQCKTLIYTIECVYITSCVRLMHDKNKRSVVIDVVSASWWVLHSMGRTASVYDVCGCVDVCVLKCIDLLDKIYGRASGVISAKQTHVRR